MRSAGATLSIDAGTTLVKAVVFDSDGHALGSSSVGTRTTSPGPAMSEQDMDEVWDAVVAAASAAASAATVGIDHVVITAQGDGAWLVDSAGDPIRPAILWNDGRARNILNRWRTDGILESAFAINGSMGNAGLPHAIMAHLLEHDSRALDGAAAALTCGGWLYSRFTGRTAMHASDASAPWLEIAAGEYSSALLDLYGLAELRDRLPPIISTRESVAPMLAVAAAAIGVSSGTPVVLAPYDVVSTGAGGGAVSPGDAFCILGTTLCTGVMMRAPDTSGTASGLTIDTSDPDRFVRAFPTLAGTGVLDWLASIIGAADAAEVIAIAADSPGGARGVNVWPYLSPAGERAPFVDSEARGVIAGLSFTHTRADIARAAVEGLAHVVRESLDAAGTRPLELALSGGGSASDLWCRTLSDITGVATTRSMDRQIGAKGAMLHAVVALEAFDSLEAAAAALIESGDRFEPNPESRAMHDARHSDFLDSRGSFATRWSNWGGGG